jgi:hypothetical protein
MTTKTNKTARCTHCDGYMSLEEDRAVCVTCGRQDHSKGVGQVGRGNINWNTIIVPYVGIQKKLKAKKMDANYRRGTLLPFCPHKYGRYRCNSPMERGTASGIKGGLRTQYMCHHKHIAYLISYENEQSFGWY